MKKLFPACLLGCNLLFAANPSPTPLPTASSQNERRYKMGNIDKKEMGFWKRTQIIIESTLQVGLLFWVPYYKGK